MQRQQRSCASRAGVLVLFEAPALGRGRGQGPCFGRRRGTWSGGGFGRGRPWLRAGLGAGGLIGREEVASFQSTIIVF